MDPFSSDRNRNLEEQARRTGQRRDKWTSETSGTQPPSFLSLSPNSTEAAYIEDGGDDDDASTKGKLVGEKAEFVAGGAKR
jgi:hypothetical protein